MKDIQEKEFTIKDKSGRTIVEIPTKHIGVVGGLQDNEERIIAGSKINSWERDCWPPYWGGNANRDISGSLGYIDFTTYTIKGFYKENECAVAFPYLGKQALSIGMFGIEPQGVKRLRNKVHENFDPEEGVLEVLLNELARIAKERDIPIITIESGSIYNFYPGKALIYPTSIYETIYNNSNSKVKFHRFLDEHNEELESVHALTSNGSEPLRLYNILKNENK